MKLLLLLTTFLLNFTVGANLPLATAYAAALPFDDISDSYAQNQIINLYQKNIISGTGDRAFEPKNPISRAEFVTMVDRLFNLQPVTNDIPSFGDVPWGAWYYKWVQSAINLDIVSGKSPTTFEPETSISRQEAATLLDRALKRKGTSASPNGLPFQDRGSIESWAVPYVNEIVALGLMTGDAGKFRPLDSITREEAAVVFDKVVQNKSWSDQLDANPARKVQLGWQYDLTNEQFMDEIQHSNVNTVSPRWFFLENTESVSDHTDTSLLTWAAGNGIDVWAMFGNRFNKELTHRILSDPAKRTAVIKQLAAYVQKYQLAGINMDFENVDASDRQGLTSFVTELAHELHLLHAKLSLDVSPDTGTDWTDAFDYAALGASADYVVQMDYDEHYDGSPIAGSVSSLPWMQKSLDKLLAVVPSSKIISALPFYTRDWTLGSKVSSEELTLLAQGEKLQAINGISIWNPTLAQYEASYVSQGAQHRIWAEDSRSLSQKYSLAENRGIAGFAYWYIGAETSDVWASLSNAAKYASYHF